MQKIVGGKVANFHTVCTEQCGIYISLKDFTSTNLSQKFRESNFFTKAKNFTLNWFDVDGVDGIYQNFRSQFTLFWQNVSFPYLEMLLDAGLISRNINLLTHIWLTFRENNYECILLLCTTLISRKFCDRIGCWRTCRISLKLTVSCM